MAQGRVKKLTKGQFSGHTILSTFDKLAILKKELATALQPAAKPDLDEWSDENRKLPKTTSAEPGVWRTSRFPFLRRPMKCLSPSSIAREISIIKGAQLGFTEICINWILYIPAVVPGPTMYVQKTKEAAEDFSTQKLDPNIEECIAVEKLLGKKKPKKLKDEVYNKGYPGGYIVMGGSNSGAFLRSKSIAYAMADEEDSFKANIDGEGSPINMIKKRMANFPFSKFFRLSTPKFTETSTILKAYESGSQEQYYVPCPCCNERADKGGTWWVIRWPNIKWGKDLDDADLPTEIYLECETCGGMIYEHQKTWMLENGEWMSEKGSKGKPYIVGDVEKPSFQISSLYSPLGFFSWRDAIEEWFEYVETQDKAKLQVFINQTLGESYNAAGQDISTSWLHERREDYRAKVPAGALCLTAGVDVQADRLEVEIVGWGLNSENWSIDYATLWGNPEAMGDSNGLDHTGQKNVWTLLDEYLQAPYINEFGQEMQVECTMVDAQYNTETVNNYCRFREFRRVYPSHGKDGWGKGYLTRPNKRHEKYKTYNVTLWVDELKDRTYNMLRIDAPGPGYCHFPNNETYSLKHFRQLISENKVVVHKGGKKKFTWELPPGARNEQLDCRNYATAALLFYAPNLEYRAKQRAELQGTTELETEVGAYPENNMIRNNPRQLQKPVIKRPKKVIRKKSKKGGIWPNGI